jgi:hypothetical protein
MTVFAELSAEQQQAFHAIKEGYHYITVACAGAGKTTTVLCTVDELVKQNKIQKCVMITYNAHLRKEVKEKVVEASLTEALEVHTFHSFATRYYQLAFDDMHLQTICDRDKEPVHPIEVDLWVLDEAQDIKRVFYHFVKKCMRDNTRRQADKGHQLWMLGDPYQCINAESGSDARYLTMADQLSFCGLDHSTFRRGDMMTSYRVTPEIAHFVNEELVQEPLLVSSRTAYTGNKVSYLITAPYSHQVNRVSQTEVVNYRLVPETIASLVHTRGISPDRIFVLAYSVKNQMVVHLADELSMRYNIPLHMKRPVVGGSVAVAAAVAGGSSSSEDPSRGKLMFSTFHSCKGLERDFVFVLGFNDSLFAMDFMKHAPKTKNGCPNLLYVATTRAKEKLYLVDNTHFLEARYQSTHRLSFLQSPLKEYVQVRKKRRYMELLVSEGMHPVVPVTDERASIKTRLCAVREQLPKKARTTTTTTAVAAVPYTYWKLDVRFVSTYLPFELQIELEQQFARQMMLENEAEAAWALPTMVGGGGGGGHEEEVDEYNGPLLLEMFCAEICGQTSFHHIPVRFGGLGLADSVVGQQNRDKVMWHAKHVLAMEHKLEQWSQQKDHGWTVENERRLRHWYASLPTHIIPGQPSTVLQHLMIRSVFSEGKFLSVLLQLHDHGLWLDGGEHRLMVQHLLTRARRVLCIHDRRIQEWHAFPDRVQLHKAMTLTCIQQGENDHVFAMLQPALKEGDVLQTHLVFEAVIDWLVTEEGEGEGEGEVGAYHFCYTSAITVEHKLQWMLTAWIWCMVYPTAKCPVFRLYNMQSGELWRIQGTAKEWIEVVRLMVHHKYYGTCASSMSDEEFVRACDMK